LEKQNPIERGSVYTILDHIDHIAKMAGVDHIGLGSDFDGITSVPEQLEDVSTYPNITQGLLDRGYTEEDIKKLLGGNVLRVNARGRKGGRGMTLAGSARASAFRAESTNLPSCPSSDPPEH